MTRPPPRSADAFARKDWYDIRTPAYFQIRTAGKTPVSRTQGTSTWEGAGMGLAPLASPCRVPPAATVQRLPLSPSRAACSR